jgi:hypothetical protein
MPDEAGRARPQDEVISEVIYSLLDKLEEADRLYGKGEDTQREGVIDALLAFMEFQSVVSDPPSHQRPINAVINALRSLDKGKVLPLLEPRRRSGRPCDSVGKEGCKGIVAHCLAAKEAVKKAAKALKGEDREEAQRLLAERASANDEIPCPRLIVNDGCGAGADFRIGGRRPWRNWIGCHGPCARLGGLFTVTCHPALFRRERHG